MRRALVTFCVLGTLGCEPRAMRLAPPPDPEKVSFVGANDVLRVAVGANDICLLMGDGTVRCKQDWRPYGERRLGSFLAVAGTREVVQLTAGHHHACARTKGGAVVCWGRNDSGEVGGDDLFVRVARVVPLPGPAAEVQVGETASCARLVAGGVHCWGNVGQAKHAPPTELGWFAKATGLALSGDTICAHDAYGKLQCSFGGGLRLEPLGDAVVRQVVLGRFRGCGALAEGDVQCFSLSRPKDAKTTGKVAAWGEPVAGLTDVVQLAAGTLHTCARRKDGSISCWGDNQYGQLGNGTRDGTTTPTRVVNVPDAIEVWAGGDRTCAMRAGKGVLCWGADLQGDAMFRALTGLTAEQGPPSAYDSLVPETLRVPTFTGTPAVAASASAP